MKQVDKPKPEARSEEEKLTRAPVMVVLGGKEFEIKPLVIRDSREWRKRAITLISALPRLLNVTMDEPEQFESTLIEMMVTKPDEVVDLFFGYAKDLNRDEIEGTATDDELATAFEEVIKLAFPLASSSMKALGNLSQ